MPQGPRGAATSLPQSSNGPTTSTAPSHSLSRGEMGGARRLGFVDALSSYSKDYPVTDVLAEGWWVRLDPWGAHVFEVVQLGDE